MKTKIIQIDDSSNIDEQLAEAATLLKEKKIVAFPTETVYGLGANGLDTKAVKRIFKAKKRPEDNPLILHVSSIKMLSKIAVFNEKIILPILEEFWPGPLTVVLQKKEIVPNVVSGGLDTVAVRMPDHPIALKLIEKCEFPLAAPSANLSGRPSPTTAGMVYNDMNKRIPLIIDGGTCQIGLESTVLDLSVKPYQILRPGKIIVDDIKPFFPKVIDFPKNGYIKKEKVKSPGVKYTHYKPDIRVILISEKTDLDALVKKENPQNPLLITLKNDSNKIKTVNFNTVEELSQKLYETFYLAEKSQVDLVFIHKIPETGLGFTLMNRLKKVADEILA